MQTDLLKGRRHVWAFVAGTAAVCLGVILHLPMFFMARSMGYRLAGMPMDMGMIWGMALIVGGLGLAAYGLLPGPQAVSDRTRLEPTADWSQDHLSFMHYRLMLVLVIALIIDVMKPASLGFVVPGMISEYGVSKAVVAWLPLSALIGTAIGSVVWGIAADLLGRRASILMSAMMFVGTSICGAMPSFWWNVGMCFLMGAAAGGMLPVTFALLAEVIPLKSRGWSLVLVGGLGAAGGYLAASCLSAVLQPIFGWRIMWLLNLPTGLILILLGGFIPESPKFLQLTGRAAPTAAQDDALPAPSGGDERRASARTIGLSLGALTWGLINFGLLLWLPANLVAKGYDIALTSKILSESALIALPVTVLASVMYGRWSAKWSLVAAMGTTMLGVAGVLHLEQAQGGAQSPILPISLLIVGLNALIATVLPYAAENYALKVRGRGAGWVAGCTKSGGIVAQSMNIAGAVPSLAVTAGVVVVGLGISSGLIILFGGEPRVRRLRDAAA